jgi:hypothetical protein
MAKKLDSKDVLKVRHGFFCKILAFQVRKKALPNSTGPGFFLIQLNIFRLVFGAACFRGKSGT